MDPLDIIPVNQIQKFVNSIFMALKMRFSILQSFVEEIEEYWSNTPEATFQEVEQIEDREKLSQKRKENVFQSTFNSYRYIDNIGSGGSGVVVRVEDKNKNTFALKYLNPDRISG